MKLVSFDEAFRKAAACASPLTKTEMIALPDSIRRVLAADFLAKLPSPSFTNSAVDGFAVFHAADLKRGVLIKVVAEAAAGAPISRRKFRQGEAVRVFTGGALPIECVAVHMQEDVMPQPEANSYRVLATAKACQHIRAVGSEFGAGECIIRAGTIVNAGSIALLASQGASRVRCRAMPAVTIIATGDELVPIDTRPKPGQIRNSNSPMLKAIVEQLGGRVVRELHVRDNFQHISSALAAAAERSDLAIISGGASVGDHDHAVEALNHLGTCSFHGVTMKPGKPVAAGKIGSCCVLCLPGNPASAFVCAHMFGGAALAKILGREQPHGGWIPAALRGRFRTTSREEFVRCNFSEGEATPVGNQASFGTVSLSQANCIARLRANQSFKPGDAVSVWLTDC